MGCLLKAVTAVVAPQSSCLSERRIVFGLGFGAGLCFDSICIVSAIADHHGCVYDCRLEEASIDDRRVKRYEGRPREKSKLIQ